MDIQVFDDVHCVLGECPIWIQEKLFWVDIKSSKIFQKGLQDAKASFWMYEDRPSALGLIAGMEDKIIVAFEKGIYHVDCISGERILIKELNGRPKNRSNDGAIGPDGAFWLGTMDDDEREQTGELLCFDGQNLIVHKRDIGVSNTFVWSPDGRFFYFADSQKQVIWRFSFDADGCLSDQQEFVSLKGTNIYPDGSAIDIEGYLWNAQWDGGRIVRYSPTGSVDKIIQLPVSRPTCCAFGGINRDILFVTSASIGVSIQDEPLAGRTLMITNVGVGISEYQFSGYKR